MRGQEGIIGSLAEDLHSIGYLLLRNKPSQNVMLVNNNYDLSSFYSHSLDCFTELTHAAASAPIPVELVRSKIKGVGKSFHLLMREAVK